MTTPLRDPVAGIVLLAFACAAHGAPRYVATMLQPPGTISTEASGTNAQGHIVGSFRTADGKCLAFLHVDGIDAVIDIPGAGTVQANAINGSGHIVGCAWFEYGGQARGFIRRLGDVELLPDVNGPLRPGCAVGINDAGVVVGHQYHDFQYSVPP